MRREGRSLARTSRPTHRYSLGPTPAEARSHRTRSRVPSPQTPDRSDPEIGSRARQGRPRRPRSRGPLLTDHGDRAPSPRVPSSRRSTPSCAQVRSFACTGPVSRSHGTGPSLVQDAPPVWRVVPPRLQDVPCTGHGLDLHDPVTLLVKEHDLPSWSDRLDPHDHQAPDLQDKDSNPAVMGSIVSSGATSIMVPCDPDRPAQGPVQCERTVRPAPRRDPDRRTHKPGFSMRGTRPVQPARRPVRSRGRVVPTEERFTCPERRSLVRRRASPIQTSAPDVLNTSVRTQVFADTFWTLADHVFPHT